MMCHYLMLRIEIHLLERECAHKYTTGYHIMHDPHNEFTISITRVNELPNAQNHIVVKRSFAKIKRTEEYAGAELCAEIDIALAKLEAANNG